MKINLPDAKAPFKSVDELVISRSNDQGDYVNVNWKFYNCKKCHFRYVDSGSRFCSQCGTKIKWIE